MAVTRVDGGVFRPVRDTVFPKFDIIRQYLHKPPAAVRPKNRGRKRRR